jgi:hypothetical protein
MIRLECGDRFPRYQPPKSHRLAAVDLVDGELFHPVNVHSRGPSIAPLANFEGEMIAPLQVVWIDAADAQRVDMNGDVRPARGVFNETDSTIGEPGFQSSSGHYKFSFRVACETRHARRYR